MDRIEDKAGGIHLIPNNITEDEWHSAPEQTYQIMFDAIFACPFIDTLQLAIKEINDKNLWKCKEANFK